MKIGNIVPRAGIEPYIPGIWASMLTLTPCRIPWCPHYTCVYLSMQLLAWAVRAAYCNRPHAIVSLTITYRQSPHIHAHRVISTVIQILHDTGHAIRAMGVMKMGNIIPRVGIKPRSPSFQASVLTITSHRLPWCHNCTHAYLSMQLFDSEVNAAY